MNKRSKKVEGAGGIGGLLATMKVTGKAMVVMAHPVKPSMVLSDMVDAKPRFPTVVLSSPLGVYPMKESFFDSIVVLGAPSQKVEDIPNGSQLKKIGKKNATFYLVK